MSYENVLAQADLEQLGGSNIEQLRELLQEDAGQVERLSPVDEVRGRNEGGAQDAVPGPAPGSPGGGPGTSAIERDYEARAGFPIAQFGYRVFDSTVPSGGRFVGAIDEQYRMGIGDELVVTFQGQDERSLSTRVDREGRVILPGLRPIPAAGRTFGDFRDELEQLVATSMIGTEVFVSFGGVRMIQVMVAGEVSRPGLHHLTGLSTVIDALYAAGGIAKTGSLRRVQVNRRDGGFTVDLYDLLLYGSIDQDTTLMDGDQIMVPSIGPTVAVGGEVKRPRIFELRTDQDPPSFAEVLEWAGGAVRPTGSRFLTFRMDRGGQDEVTERRDLSGVLARNGDILVIQEQSLRNRGSAHLTGHVRDPGVRSVASTGTVGRLVGNMDALWDEPYLPFAAISRVDRRSGARDLIAIDLAAVLRGETDEPLEADDIFIVLGLEDVRYLASTDVQSILSGKPPRAELLQGGGVCRGLVQLANILASERAGRFAVAMRGLVAADPPVPNLMTCPPIYERFPELLVFLLEHAVALNTEVRTPGIYPALPGTRLASIVDYAGGLTREADLTDVEVSRLDVDVSTGKAELTRTQVNLLREPLQQVRVYPGDIIRFNPVFTDRDNGPVVIIGEVRRPGVYDITRGERLSQVIERAGGLTDQAYPMGAVFSREEEKHRERANFARYARDLQNGLTVALSSGRLSDQGGPAAVQIVKDVIEQLKQTEPVGRVVVEADPTVLQVHPEQDTILSPGDRLFIPKRPNSVTVTGSVLNSSSVAFKPGTKVDEYIAMAGGYAPGAEKDRGFVVLPNGVAQPLKVSAWNYNPVQIPPGSTIVVPRNPTPFDTMVFTRDILDVLSKLAITAASLAVIGSN